MGRVGSSTVAFACEELPQYQTYHTHFLNMERIEGLIKRAEKKQRDVAGNIKRSLVVINDVLPSGCDVKFITLVRDPVARNVSGCFADYLLDTKGQPSAPLTRDVVEARFKDFYHDRPEWWFDRELKTPLGIDVLASPFNKEEQVERRKYGRFDLLLMQTEMPDEKKVAALREFLETDDIDLKPRNVHAKKDDRYHDFLAYVPIDEEYMDRFYNLPYVRHFYTDEAIDGFRRRWRDRAS